MKIVYRPTARVLTGLELLEAQGRRTRTELARRQEVDIRTVRNYIQTLADLGVPISAERGSYGAYILRPGYKLPVLATWHIPSEKGTVRRIECAFTGCNCVCNRGKIREREHMLTR